MEHTHTDARCNGNGSPAASAARPDTAEAWRRSTGSARSLRYVSLLYTCFFFIEPYYRQSRTHWMWFAAFYVTFLMLYVAIPMAKGRAQQVLFVLLFALAFVYFPFNESASGAFVYPVVMLAFVLRSTRLYLTILALQLVGIALETWIFDVHVWAGAMGAFFCVVIGLSNLAYSRQRQASFMLQRANEEIEHLAQVAERERIARDLHDLLGHTLTVIAIKSELATRILSKDPQRAQQEMEEVTQTARNALADVREAVAGYRSEGIASEMVRARRTLLAANVRLTVSLDPVELAPAQANVLCLCVREAVTNIVRHAQASTCSVTLSHVGGSMVLSIVDDGLGIGRPEGNGLRGMRERVAAQGGRMVLETLSPRGTQLRVNLPAPVASHGKGQLEEAVQA